MSWSMHVTSPYIAAPLARSASEATAAATPDQRYCRKIYLLNWTPDNSKRLGGRNFFLESFRARWFNISPAFGRDLKQPSTSGGRLSHPTARMTTAFLLALGGTRAQLASTGTLL